MTRRKPYRRLGRIVLGAALAAVVTQAAVACSSGQPANERSANNALGRDSAGSTTTGTGVSGSGGPSGYAQPGQGGALGDTMQGRTPPAGQGGPAPGASLTTDSGAATPSPRRP